MSPGPESPPHLVELDVRFREVDAYGVVWHGHFLDWLEVSGLKTSVRVDAPEEVAELWMRHRALGMTSSLLLANPIPEAEAIPSAEVERLVAAASSEAAQKNISGQALTPFLLQRLGEMSEGRLRQANNALLLSNARLAARIASALVKRHGSRKAEV